MKRVLAAVSLAVLAVAALVFFLVFRPVPSLPPVHSDLLDPAGNAVLYVSNQSFAIDPVDIQIWIDGECVVRDYFEVKNQHNWRPFRLRLSEGAHQLTAKSEKGDADLTKPFTVPGNRWAVVSFWYYPRTHYDPTPRHFSFDVFDRPPGFE